MVYRVIVWGAGQKGSIGLREIIEHPDLELAGVRVFSESKAGKDAATLVPGGAPNTGIKTTTSTEEILNLDADVVIHSSRREPDPARMNEDVMALLASGKNVISTAGFIWPWAHGSELPRRLEQACWKGGSTLFGTGIVPGFVGERLSLTLTGLTLRMDRIYMREVFDVTWEVPHKLFDVIGVGREPSWHNPDSITAKTQTYYFSEEVYCLAHHLGVEVERLETRLETPLANRDIQLKHGLIRKGTVAAVSWSWIGWVKGKPFIELENVWYVDPDLPNFDPTNGWTTKIYGDTEMTMTLRTADRDKIGYQIIGPALRAIPWVCSAPAGILKQPAFAPWNEGYRKPSGAPTIPNS